ncbi:hypothetical protein F4776DRAFT_671341 [Hypoxylon sp. NC0597]|nr:hypothetical protein F4776DRAFT_671341 [Hypoxylon sp. NC0597]
MPNPLSATRLSNKRGPPKSNAAEHHRSGNVAHDFFSKPITPWEILVEEDGAAIALSSSHNNINIADINIVADIDINTNADFDHLMDSAQSSTPEVVETPAVNETSDRDESVTPENLIRILQEIQTRLGDTVSTPHFVRRCSVPLREILNMLSELRRATRDISAGVAYSNYLREATNVLLRQMVENRGRDLQFAEGQLDRALDELSAEHEQTMKAIQELKEANKNASEAHENDLAQLTRQLETFNSMTSFVALVLLGLVVYLWFRA